VPNVPGMVIGSSGSAYHDSFHQVRSAGDQRSALDWFRAAFEGAPRPMRWVLVVGWRAVLLLRLDGGTSPLSVLGWRVTRSDDTTAQLGADSPLMTAVLTLNLRDRDVEWTTDVSFRNRAGRILWALSGPLHRVVVPHRLRRAADAAP
jgi:hypothetical protein